MKNLLLLFLGISILACGNDIPKGPVFPKVPNNFYGKLEVNGAQLSDSDGNPVVLKGVSLGWHNWWPRFYNEGTIKWVKDDWGVNVIRAAIGVEPDGAFLDNPENTKQKIKSVVEAAIENDLYVIIDWHSHKLLQEDALNFFKEMAEEYGQYPNVIYELFNEPVDYTWPEIKTYSETIIKEIRKVDPDNLILVGTPNWSQDVNVAALDPIEDQKNLMYVLHFYAGTHQKYLRDKADIAIGLKLPLFISECAGMEASGDGPIDKVSWDNWMTWMNQNKLSWVAWSIADKDETCSMLYPEASDFGNWKVGDIKPWGEMVKSYLKK